MKSTVCFVLLGEYIFPCERTRALSSIGTCAWLVHGHACMYLHECVCAGGGGVHMFVCVCVCE